MLTNLICNGLLNTIDRVRQSFQQYQNFDTVSESHPNCCFQGIQLVSTCGFETAKINHEFWFAKEVCLEINWHCVLSVLHLCFYSYFCNLLYFLLLLQIPAQQVMMPPSSQSSSPQQQQQQQPESSSALQSSSLTQTGSQLLQVTCKIMSNLHSYFFFLYYILFLSQTSHLLCRFIFGSYLPHASYSCVIISLGPV